MKQLPIESETDLRKASLPSLLTYHGKKGKGYTPKHPSQTADLDRWILMSPQMTTIVGWIIKPISIPVQRVF